MKWLALVLITGLLSGAAIGIAPEFDEEEGLVTEEIEESGEVSEAEESVSYQSPHAEPGKYYLAEHFDDPNTFEKKWIKSETKKDDIAEEIAKYDGVWELESPQRAILRGDLGLVLKSKAKHAAISSRLSKPFVFSDKPLIVQYEVTLQDGQECGGAYLKLLSSGKETTDLKNFQDKTPYTIMFGPDKCGNDIKLHFIFRHVNPINGSITEKHSKKPKERLEEPFKDKLPHLYQLELRPDNTFTIRVDHKIVNEGSMLADFTPAVNPPHEIDDPKDTKPADWDEREKIPDPDAKKPEDWNEDAPPQIPDENAVRPDGWLDNEEEMISDPSAIKPDDWDQDMDGEWEAPLIPNPLCEGAVGCGLWKAPMISNPHYKGKWRAPLLDNPNYQGKWSPRKIQNPEFFEDLNPFKMTPISALGLELWSMSSDILFDNFVITDNMEAANEWAAQTFDLKRKQLDKDATSLWEQAMKSMNYKPGWWVAYFFYCLIPISAYVWYLRKRSKEDQETFLTRLISFTNENPWIWVVYVVVVGLPLVAIIYSIFSTKKSLPQSDAKKTDEVQPDDDESAGDNFDASESNVKSNKSASPEVITKTKKTDLEEPIIQNEAYGEEEEEEEDDVEEGANESEEDDVENVENVNENPIETKETEIVKEVPTESAGVKKRRPRKD